MSSTDPRVPIDILECILDVLDEDITALKACSFVCREWLPSLRRRLFKKITLYPNTEFNGFVTVLNHSPGILHCIKEVTIRCGTENVGRFGSITSLRLVCSKLFDVERFRISHAFVYENDTDHLLEIVSSFALSIKKVLIDWVHFEKSADILRLINAFPNIHDLSVMETRVIRGRGLSYCGASAGRLPEGLHSLKLCECKLPVLHSLLSAAAPRLRNLRIHGLGMSQTIWKLEPAIYWSLESLEIPFFTSFYEPSDNIHLPIMPRLAFFKATLFLQDCNTNWICKLISDVPETVQVMHLVFKGGLNHLCDLNWIDIEHMIASRGFDEAVVEIKSSL